MNAAIFQLVGPSFTAANISNLRARIVAAELSIRELYLDLANAHFASAQQALASYLNGSQQRVELFNCISHTRDAYNVLNQAIDRTKIRKAFFVFEVSEPYLEAFERITAIVAAGMMARNIAELYTIIDEEENVKFWNIEQRRQASNLESGFENCFSARFRKDAVEFFAAINEKQPDLVEFIPEYDNGIPEDYTSAYYQFSDKGKSVIRSSILSLSKRPN